MFLPLNKVLEIFSEGEENDLLGKVFYKETF